jgi:hypothetical protein
MEYLGHPLIDWRDPTLGAMNRTACWLLAVVGVGNTFTKQQLRAAVPGREQVDRRMRDLRKYGWRIDEKRDDDNLAPNELRFVEPGLAVWVKSERAKGAIGQVSDSVRQAVFKRDGHMCVRCGIAAGDYFDDRPGVRARLTLAHIYPGKLRAASRPDEFVTACQRCNESLRQHTDAYRTGEQVWESIKELSRRERLQFLEWVQSETRPRQRIDFVWAEYRQLSGAERDEVRRRLLDRTSPLTPNAAP